MHYTTECDVAVAQVSVSFLFAYWDVSDCFSVKADALNSVGNRNVQYAADYLKKTLWHQLFRWSNYCLFSGK